MRPNHRQTIIVSTDPSNLGEQRIYWFPNGFGASVVRRRTSPVTGPSYGAGDGLWELAVVRFPKNAKGPTDFTIAYNTPVCKTAIAPSLREKEASALLEKIQGLKPTTRYTARP
jgi:hypothetical protein